MSQMDEYLRTLDERLRSCTSELKQAERELSDLGDRSSSIVVKKINGNQYYYEQWREDGRIVGKSLGRVAPGVIVETESIIEQRRDLTRRIYELRFLLEHLTQEKNAFQVQMQRNLHEDCLSFEVYWKNELSARITSNQSRIHVSRFIVQSERQIFSDEFINRNQLLEVLRLRCFDEGTQDTEENLRKLGLTEYDPLEIVRRTHGVLNDDYIWIRFPGEDLRAEDVLISLM